MGTKALETLREDVLALPLDERAELVRDLMASLDGPADPNVQEAWDAELCQRINKLRAGEATLLEPEDVLARIRQRLSRA